MACESRDITAFESQDIADNSLSAIARASVSVAPSDNGNVMGSALACVSLVVSKGFRSSSG